jgi:hypothetical protein
MEPAEGSRKTVRESGNDLGSSTDRAMFDERVPSGQQGSGISNRPLDQEESEQEQLPERGRAKSDGSTLPTKI